MPPSSPHLGRPAPDRSGPEATWLGPDSYGDWDRFVARHPHGMIFHLSSWARVIEKSFPHMRAQIVALREPGNGAILAGLPVYDVRSWLLGNRLVSIPFASLCDPLVSDPDQWRALMSEVEAHRARRRNVPFECRTWRHSEPPPVSGNCPSEISLHHRLDLTPGLDAVYSGFSRTAIRRMITKSKAGGTRIRPAESESDIAEFYRLLVISRRRNGLPTLPYAFFLSIWRFLEPRQRSFILASREDRDVAAVFSLGFRENFTMEHSGEEDSIYGTGVIQHLVWEAIRTAHGLGCTLASFGRTAPENTGLASYKLHWGTVEEKLYTYWPGSPPIQRQAVATTSPTRRVIGWLSCHSPSPVYHAMSAFCYKHWG